MEDIFVGIYWDQSEADQWLFTNAHTDLEFSTELPGGYSSCSFTFKGEDYDPEYLYKFLPHRHLVLYDGYGHHLWEGDIDNVEMTEDGFNVSGSGYYARAKDVCAFVVQPNGITAGSLMRDMVDMIPYWQHVHTLMKLTSFDLGAQVLPAETKVNEVIDKALAYGTDDGIAFFALYGTAIPQYFTGAAQGYGELGWHAQISDLTVQVGASVNLDSVYNKIQVIWDNGNGIQIGDWLEDANSQRMYGVREGTLNLGNTLDAIADTIGDLTLKTVAYPTESLKLNLTAVISSTSGLSQPLYMVRAGSYLYIDDAPANNYSVSDIEGIKRFMIMKTTYNASDGTIDIEVGSNKLTLEMILTQLNMSGGGVQ